ncbi:MAG: hypothetical protein ACJ0QQ_00010 [Parvicellaceae bacterium]
MYICELSVVKLLAPVIPEIVKLPVKLPLASAVYISAEFHFAHQNSVPVHITPANEVPIAVGSASS